MSKNKEKITMIGFKGFAPGMICRGKHYKENTVYEENSAEICRSGMHFCEHPFNVWDYYPPCDGHGNLNEFSKVEALDDVKTDDGKKFCTRQLKIGAKLKLADFIDAGVEFILERVKDNTEFNTGDCSAATNTGNWSAATNTGNWSAATNTGNCSAASVNGKESFAICTGRDGKAKGALGCYIAFAEWKQNDAGDWHLVDFKTAKVDGKIIKVDTYYKLVDGEFIESK